MTGFVPDAAAATDERMRAPNRWQRLRRHPAGNIAVVFLGGLLACIVVSLLFPADFRFLSTPNIVVMLKGIPLLGFIALGVGILMIAGEFDLSVGATYLLTSYLMALAYSQGWPLGLAVALAIVTGLVIGLVNGIITTQLRIPSFITTLGTYFIVRGIMLFASSSRPINFFPGEFFQDLLTGKFLGSIFPTQFLWFVIFAVLAYLLVHKHRLGNHFLAVGGSREVAAAVGINVDRVKITAFMLCSLGTTVAAIIGATRVNGVHPVGSTLLELQAIAVCVVGGLSLFGGRGSVLGVVLGAFFINLVRDVLFLAAAPGLYLEMFFGAVIVIAVILNIMVAKR